MIIVSAQTILSFVSSYIDTICESKFKETFVSFESKGTGTGNVMIVPKWLIYLPCPSAIKYQTIPKKSQERKKEAAKQKIVHDQDRSIMLVKKSFNNLKRKYAEDVRLMYIKTFPAGLYSCCMC